MFLPIVAAYFTAQLFHLAQLLFLYKLFLLTQLFFSTAASANTVAETLTTAVSPDHSFLLYSTALSSSPAASPI